MNYQDAADYIGSIPKFTKKNPLAHTKDMMKRLGSPAAGCRVVHVAGTNGKGSVCTFINAILRAENKRAGLFTSPHLVSLKERFAINDRQVSDEAFLTAFNKVYKTANELKEEGAGHPSYFEFLYAMAMLIFDAAGVEYIVLETGLGGRLDATNSFEHPAVSVITSIGMDHMAILGDTIEKIAAEKAGIIRPGVPVIFDGTEPAAAGVIRSTAERVGAPYTEIDTPDERLAFMAEKGGYQMMNATLAVTAAALLLDRADYHKKLWLHVLSSVHIHGRMEEVMPHITIDGGHNISAVRAFSREYQRRTDPRARNVIVFTAVSDKDYPAMIRYLCEHCPAQEYIVTELKDDRRVPAERLRELFMQNTDCPVEVIRDVSAVMDEAVTLTRSGASVFCLGSLYLVGEIEDWMAAEGGKNVIGF